MSTGVSIKQVEAKNLALYKALLPNLNGLIINYQRALGPLAVGFIRTKSAELATKCEEVASRLEQLRDMASVVLNDPLWAAYDPDGLKAARAQFPELTGDNDIDITPTSPSPAPAPHPLHIAPARQGMFPSGEPAELSSTVAAAPVEPVAIPLAEGGEG